MLQVAQCLQMNPPFISFCLNPIHLMPSPPRVSDPSAEDYRVMLSLKATICVAAADG